MTTPNHHLPVRGVRALIAAAGVVLALVACQPEAVVRDVTEEFWVAMTEGDAATVRALALDPVPVLPDTRDAVTDFTLGAVTRSGETAEVVTTFTTRRVEAEIEFTTLLERRDGEWKVDVQQTAVRFASASLAKLAEVFEELSEQLGEQ